MRTRIDIDDDLRAQAMKTGPFKTRTAAVEAGLRLPARRVACREVLEGRGLRGGSH